MPPANFTLDALADGAIILTANQRAARFLRRQWDELQHHSGEAIWSPANVFTWDEWCAERWIDLIANGSDDRLLLLPFQEHALWQQTIKDHFARGHQQRSVAAPMENTSSLALEAIAANSLLDKYAAAEAFPRHTGNYGVEAFRRWRQTFLERCEKLRLLPAASLADALTAAFKKNLLPVPNGKLLLVGFDLFTPAQTRLLNTLQSLGCATEVLHPKTRTANAQQITCPTPRDELHSAALWARHFLQQQPDSRIAIILSDGDARRAETDRIFRRVLAPQHLDITASPALPYEFSLGTDLSRHPMTAAALTLLHWCLRPLPFEEATALMRSPWIAASQEEQNLCLQFELKHLRHSTKLLPEISLDDVLRLAQAKQAAALLTRLETFRRSLTQPQGALRTHSEWATLIHAVLHATGWPGTHSLESNEYQLFDRWKRLLDDFTRLDFQPVRITLDAALAELEFMAGQTLFAPESQNAPVQILGVLESAGSEFDAIWFAGATAHNWPQRGDTHALLPFGLQRDFKMPHADPSADYELALTLQQRILASAPAVVFSHYLNDTDGAQLPSPLLHESSLPAAAEGADTLPPLFPAHTLPVEVIDAVGALPTPPDATLKGGSNLLKAQSLCAFRAFAEYRLHSAPPEPVEFGIDARDSGNVVHHILQKFWNEVKTHTALLQLSHASREKRLRELAAVELQRIIQPASPLEQSALAVQLDAVSHLLLEWLEVEAARPPFSVAHTEHSITGARIGPLQLDLRCDRIDHVENDAVLIDYKTGMAAPSDWTCPRPNEPQLPLYAVAGAVENLSAIAFASIRPGDIELAGVQGRAGILKFNIINKDGTLSKKNNVEDLPQRIAQWQAELTRLAENFHNGLPEVAPKESTTCDFCHQAVLCRIAEHAASSDEDDAALELVTDE